MGIAGELRLADVVPPIVIAPASIRPFPQIQENHRFKTQGATALSA